MKILIVAYTTRNYLGGAESYLNYLEKGLKKRGVSVESIYLDDTVSPICWKTTKFYALIRSFGIYDRYCVFAVKSFMKHLERAVRKKIEEFKPDLIHAQDVSSAAAVSFLAKKNNIPLIMTDHGILKPEGNLYQRLILENEKIAMENVKKVICVAEHMKKALNQKHPTVPTTVIYNSIDVEEFIKRGEREENVFSKKPYILIVARLISYKGVDVAIYAFCEVIKEFSNYHLVIVGHGPLYRKLKELAKSLGVKDYVHFLGGVKREKIPVFYKEADIIWIPSKSDGKTTEPCPIVSFEAMVFSKPIVATNEGGPGEVYKKGGAILVSPGDWQGLADATIELIKNLELRKKISQEAGKIVRENYNINKWLDKMINLYQEILIQKNKND